MKKLQSQCSTEELKILGDFWTLNIIQELAVGPKRFSEIERGLPKINPTTLTNRLKNLENKNLIKRTKETVDKQSVMYSLTEKGYGIIPILNQIKLFAEKYL